MANVWKYRDGDDPISGGGLLSRLTLTECRNVLGLSHGLSRFIGRPGSFPTFRTADDRLAAYRGFRHIVVEIDEGEAETGWPAGYYYLEGLSVAEATRRLAAHEANQISNAAKLAAGRDLAEIRSRPLDPTTPPSVGPRPHD